MVEHRQQTSCSTTRSKRHMRYLLLALVLCFTFLPMHKEAEAQPTAPQAAVSLTKRLVNPTSGRVEIDQEMVFEIKISNTGSKRLDVIPLGDSFDPTYLRFVRASVNGQAADPDQQLPNLIAWNDLTQLAHVGDLAPGDSITIQTTFLALAATEAGGGLSPTTPSGPPGTPLPGTTVPGPVPSDYYDKETKFVIDHALDHQNGGIYLALHGDGSPWDLVPDRIYGFAPNFFPGTSKHPGGQAICIEYFLREYQRLSQTGGLVQTDRFGTQNAEDMLKWAKLCADFVNDYLIIGQGQNEPNPPVCTSGDGNRCVYYWGFVNADGRSGHMPPVGSAAQYSSPNSHHIMDSFVAWMQSELALLLFKHGDPSYTIYRDAATAYLDWAFNVGAPYHSNPATATDPSYAGRDRFWAGLLMSLYEMSVAEGSPIESYRNNAIDCINSQGSYAANIHTRGRCNGTSYTTAYGRAAAHALEVQNHGNDPYYNGGHARWHNYGQERYGDDPNAPNNPTIAFAHGSGRELVAGLQRLHWFYYTFPEDPDPNNLTSQTPPGGAWTVESWSHQAILDYWNYSIANMWDNTPGQEAWWEAQLRPGATDGYKPCFSLGTPLPIGDWAAPKIGDKVHTINPDGSATVTVSGVVDEAWDFLSWQMRGIGIKAVRVFYSVDDGATWQSVPTTPTSTPGTYTATIPPQPGKTVRYYAEAEDDFGNISTFPANAPQIYQLYTLNNSTHNMAWAYGIIDSDGGEVPGDGDDTEIEIPPRIPSAITLRYLNAEPSAEGTQITWESASEQNTFGYHVYRSDSGKRADAQRLNATIIPAHGPNQEYRLLDAQAPDANTVYWLVEVELNQKETWYRIGGVTSLFHPMVYIPLVIKE